MTSLIVSGPYFWSGIAHPGLTLPPPMDWMHIKGHIDLWCKKTCDPKLFPQIDKVNIILKGLV